MTSAIAVAVLLLATPDGGVAERPSVFFTDQPTQLIIPGSPPQVLDLPPVYIMPPETVAALDKELRARPTGGLDITGALIMLGLGVVAGGVACYFVCPR